MTQHTDKDQALSLLLNTAPAPNASPEEVGAYDNLITQLASADYNDQGIRAAALQLRLPDVDVGVNEEGNLSFSDRQGGGSLSEQRFRTKRLEVAEGTYIIGEGNDINVIRTGSGPTFEQQAKRAQQSFSTSKSHSLSLLNKLAQIDKMQNIADREKALIDLDSSIDLALNDRRLELTEMAGDAFGVTEIETRLRSAEAADRADPRWSEFKHDSPATQTIRQELSRARMAAQQQADRDFTTDSIANELAARRKQSTALLSSEKDTQRRGLSPDSLLETAYSTEDRAMLEAMYQSAQGEEAPDAASLIAFAQSNKTVAQVLEGDAIDVAVHAFTKGTQDQALVSSALLAAETAKVGQYRAEQRMQALEDNYKILQETLRIPDEEFKKFAGLGTAQAEFEALRQQQQQVEGITSTASATQQKHFAATINRRLMTLAKDITLAREVSSFVTATTHDYPIPENEALRGIVDEAITKKLAPTFIMKQAAEQGLTKQANDYLTAHYINKADSVVFGSSRNNAIVIQTQLNSLALGLSDASIVTNPSNFQSISNFISDSYDKTKDDLGSLTSQIYNNSPLSIPERVIDWGNAPREPYKPTNEGGAQ